MGNQRPLAIEKLGDCPQWQTEFTDRLQQIVNIYKKKNPKPRAQNTGPDEFK